MWRSGGTELRYWWRLATSSNLGRLWMGGRKGPRNILGALARRKIFTDVILFFGLCVSLNCRCQWPRGLKRRVATARLLRSWVRIPPGAWMFVCCECCVLSGRGLCDELITRREESYRLLYVIVCDLERMRKLWPALGRRATEKKSLDLNAECGCFSVFRQRKAPYLVEPLERALLSHWTGPMTEQISF